MNNGVNIPNGPESVGNAANAVSLYGQSDGVEDFPVLKAFQQYIDAEQSKARKRLIGLCMFFGFLMTVVIAVFTIMLVNMSSRNQVLSDRYMDYLMKDRESRAQAAPAPSPENEQALKAFQEAIVSMQQLQKQIADRQAGIEESERARQDAERARAATLLNPPTSAQDAEDKVRKMKTQAEKLRKVQESLKAEKEKLAAEKERLRQKEIDLQRRKLYPEYYEKQARAEAAAKSAAAMPATTVSSPSPSGPSRLKATSVEEAGKQAFSYFDKYADMADEVEEAYEDELEDEEEVEPVKAKPAAKAKPKKVVAPKSEVKAKVRDDYEVPLEVKGKKINWAVPAE